MLASSLAFAPRPAQAQGPQLVSTILNKMERNRRDLHSLRSAITMQKYNAQLKDYDTYFGDVQYVAGKAGNSNVRVDWKRPVVEQLAVKNGEYALYRPRLNTVYKGSSKSASKNNKVNSVLGFSLSASGAQLRNQFDVEFIGDGQLYDGGPQIWLLKLTPKGPAGYQFAEVWVDQSTGMPVQTRVTEKNGDFTTVRLTNIERNANVPSNVFDLELPAGVKVVRG
jgi:outer membrane lipoprotein-sorting protein